jgi:hypothetical protein
MENKTTKYLKYAIGEIVLVVIGILIALQINNWNSIKNDRQMEKQYLENFLIEMRVDSAFLNGYWANTYPKKVKGLQLARQFQKYNIVVTDTVAFLTSIGIGGAASRTSLFESRSTYNDIISTGNIRLIENENIRNQILYYYTLTTNTISYMDNLRTEYATFVNSINPYDPLKNFVPDAKDYKRALESMKSDAFLGMANNELTYAYSLKNRLDRSSIVLLKAMEMIKSELKKMN